MWRSEREREKEEAKKKEREREKEEAKNDIINIIERSRSVSISHNALVM